MQVDSDARAYDALSEHPRAADLATIAHSVMTAAAQVKRADGRPDHLAKLAAEMRLPRDEAVTPFGNALDVLERGPEDDAQRALARALAAHAVALFPPKGADDEARLASDLLWLATHTPFDATGLLDRALGERAGGLWDAIAERVRRIDAGSLASLGRGEALVGGAALACSCAPAAGKQADTLAAQVHDQTLARVLGASRNRGPLEPIRGEMMAPAHGPLATTLLAISGILLILQAARILGRLALAYKSPAEVVLLDQGRGGVRVRWHIQILGRRLGDRDVVLPRGSLVRAAREVRYPRLALYMGLLSLAAGSYVGASAFVDGLRAASPSLLASGLAIIAVGIALDFALSSIVPGARGRCRMVFVQRDGATVCVGGVDPKSADGLLTRLSGSAP